MPTTVFPLTAGNCVMEGYWPTSTFSGRNYCSTEPAQNGGAIYLYLTGTALSLNVQSQFGGNFSVTVDGGSASSVSAPSGGFALTPFASGLTEGNHLVKITVPDTGCLIDLGTGSPGTGASVTGAAPALSIPPGYGPNYYVPGATKAPAGQTSLGAYFAKQGAPISPYLSTISLQSVDVGQGFSVYGNPTDLYICAGSGNSLPNRLALYKDGDLLNIFTIPANNLTKFAKCNTAALDGQNHLYTIVNLAANSLGIAAVNIYIGSIMFVGGDLTHTTPATLPYDFFWGDSITFLLALDIESGHDVRESDCWPVATAQNHSMHITGNSGQRIAFALANITQATSLPTDPARIWLRWTHNDVYYGTTIGTLPGSAGEYTHDYNAVLLALRSRFPTTPIVCEGYWPSNDPGQGGTHPASNAPAYNAAIQAAIANNGSPISACTYLDMTGCYNISLGTIDGTHPNSTGYAGAANYELASLDTTAPTVPGSPASNKTTNVAVTVTWQPSTDNLSVQGSLYYRLYKDGGGSVYATTAPGVTAFSETQPADGSTHTFEISAVDAAGNASAKSSPISVVYSAPTGAAPKRIPARRGR